eukprot:scaffold3971_cov417-Prasinococcus_capsulatus_cf.AAC.6
MDDPAVLRREIEEKRRKAAEAALKRDQEKLGKKQKELVKWTGALVPPAELFKSGANRTKYSEWDEDGLPTKTAQGEDMTKNALKACRKEQAQQARVHDELLAKGDFEAFIADLRAEVDALQATLATR